MTLPTRQQALPRSKSAQVAGHSGGDNAPRFSTTTATKRDHDREFNNALRCKFGKEVADAETLAE